MAEAMQLHQQRLDHVRASLERGVMTLQAAWLAEATALGMLRGRPTPPMGPSTARPGAGNSAPVRALAAGLQKSPVDGPMQGPVVRSGLVRWQ